MTTIYLVRHGESEANVQRVFSNGRVDLPLSERGRLQAQRLARWLHGRGAMHVYSAPLLRARETAAIVGGQLGLPVDVIPDLDEVRVGDLDGRRDTASWETYDAVMLRWRAAERTAAFPGGECFGDAYDRFAGALREIARRHPGPAGAAGHSGSPAASVIAITHGGIQLTVIPRLCSALGDRIARGELPWVLRNAAINVLEVEPSVEPSKDADGIAGGFTCVTWGASAEPPV